MSARIPVLARAAFTTPTLSLFLVLVIAALSYVGVAAGTLVTDGRTATTQRSVTSLPLLTRWPSAMTPGLPAPDNVSRPGTGVWGSALADLEAKRQEQPEPLRSLLGTPRLTVTVDALQTIDEDSERDTPVPINRVSLVSDPRFLDRVSVAEGRLPEVTDPADGIEFVLTATGAEQLDWPVNTERRWGDTSLTLTGIVAPTGTNDDDWAFIAGSAAPLIEVGSSGDRILVAAGFMHVDEAAALTDRVQSMKIASWMPFDDSAIETSTAEKTAAQLRRLAADPANIELYDETFYNRGLGFNSSLPRAIDTGVARGEAMTAVVAVAAVGPVAVALVVLALVSRLIAAHRVVTSRVLRARGASAGRLSTLLGLEGTALGILGAVIGAGAASMGMAPAGVWVFVAPAVLAAVPAIVLPWSTLTDAKRRGRRDLGETSRTGPATAALQIAILIVTAVVALLIVVRGSTGGADPLLLSLPVLLGGAGSILSLRLLPVLLRIAERRGAHRASLAALLGPARARRAPVMRTAPVLAIVVGLGVAVFSVAFAATVTGGIVRSAAINVGADVRVDASYITADASDRVADLEGVAALAGLRGHSSLEASAGANSARANVYAVDRDAFVAVQRGSSTALPLPAALTEHTEDGIVPAVASETLLAKLGLSPEEAAGQEFEVGGTTVRVVATATSEMPFGTAEQWLIIDAAHAADLGQRNTGISQLYLALTPDADPDAVGAAAVATLGGDAVFEPPARAAAVYEQDPAFGLTQGALLAASGIVALLLTVAIIATLVLGAPSRARMLAILRTLGYPQRAAGRLVAWEVAPALLLTLPFGAGVGIAMAWLVIPQLDLSGFVGGSAQPPVVLGGAWPVLVVAGFAAVVGGAVLAATATASRIETANAIRADGEDEQP